VDRCRQALEQALGLLAQCCTLAESVNASINAPPANPDDLRPLLLRVLSAIEPQGASLAAKIEEILQAAQASPPQIPAFAQLQPLLVEAAAQVKPKAAVLATKIRDGLHKTPSLTVADWLLILKEIAAYLTPPCTVLTESIKEALKPAPNADPDPQTERRWRSLLSEALGIVYDNTDTNFASLASWHNKTAYLVVAGLLLIIALAGALQHGVLFLAGAAGGLLSRLSRSLYRQDVPTDYGASWTSLFLSPVVGALAGWSGVLVVNFAVQVNVLGAFFKTDWCNPWSPFTLGIALAMGFSERLFDTILKQLEDKTAAQVQTKATQAGDLSITTGSALSAKANAAYSQRMAASGGTAPYKWILSAGKLPDGLNLDATGMINGTPTVANTFKFTLQVSDATSKTKSQEFTFTVSH
jgi:hypothetical protein